MKYIIGLICLALCAIATVSHAQTSVLVNGSPMSLPLSVVVAPTPTATPTVTPTPVPAFTPTPVPVLFTITQPTMGQTVSGTIKVTLNIPIAGSCTDLSTIYWTWLAVDGVATVSGYNSLSLDTSKLSAGVHQLTVSAYSCSSPTAKLLGTRTVSINVVAPVVHFSTLGPGATLPTVAQCIAQVRANPLPEVAPWNQDDGTGYNNNQPPASIPSYFYQYAGGYLPNADFQAVDGNFSGSTEDIMRWGACKWGIDEDIVRAQSWQESGWHQATHGDWDAPAGCTPNLPVTSITPNGQFCVLQGLAGAAPGHQYDSWSIIQIKVYYFWNTWPMVAKSTPFAIDYRFAEMRACMNGDQFSYFKSQDPTSGTDYINAVNAAKTNPTGPSSHTGWNNQQYITYGCIGTHFTGGWNPNTDPGGYIASIINAMNTKPWPK